MSLAKLRRFNSLVKKTHIYLALLNLSIVLVFGIAGLKASLDLRSHKPPSPQVRFVEYTPPGPVIDDKCRAALET